MRKYSLKELKNLVRIGAAEDITNYSFEEVRSFNASRTLDKVGYSSGTYGINGGLLKDYNTGELFAITARNSTLMQLF